MFRRRTGSAERALRPPLKEKQKPADSVDRGGNPRNWNNASLGPPPSPAILDEYLGNIPLMSKEQLRKHWKGPSSGHHQRECGSLPSAAGKRSTIHMNILYLINPGVSGGGKISQARVHLHEPVY